MKLLLIGNLQKNQASWKIFRMWNSLEAIFVLKIN